MKLWGNTVPGRSAFRILVMAALQGPVLCASARAQTPQPSAPVVHAFDVPAGQLDRVLVTIAEQGHRPISFDAGLTANALGHGVKGTMTTGQAIDQALADTGFEQFTTSGGALSIRRKPVPTPHADAQSASDAPTLPQIVVRDSLQSAAGQFAGTASASATRTDTPLTDIPQSVQVITQEVMRSQQTQSVEDILSNVSNVTISPSTVGQDMIQIRGFAAPVSTDGLMTDTYQNALAIPLIGVAQVDVLKGADSILAGSMQPGGVVNVVRKQPQADRVNEVTLQTGSYGEMQAGFDSAGALSADQRLTYRFVVSGDRTSESYGGGVGQRTLYLAPSVGYRTASSNLVVGFTQNTEHVPVPLYTMIVDGSPAKISSPIGGADDHMRINDTSVYYDFTQKLLSNWTFRSKASYDASVTSYYDNDATELDDSGLASFYPVAGALHQRTLSLEETLQAKYRTGPVSQTFLAGFSWQRNLINTATGGDFAALTTGSIFTENLPEVQLPASGFVTSVSDYSYQAYLQDQIALFDRLHVLASISHAQARNDYSSGKEYSEGAWSPNIGVLYQLTGELGFYANYLRSFTPQGTDFLANGEVAPPAIGKSVEIGLKGSFLDDKLIASANAFRSAVTNMVVQAGPTILDNELIPGGTVSRGVEFDVSGEILPGWNVIANYAYTDQTSPEYQSSISLLPRHSFRLWTTYAFRSEALHGWSIGGGIKGRSAYQGESTGKLPSYYVPGQASTDITVSYHRKDWSIAFGVKNLLNRNLYGDTATNSFLAVYPGRTFVLTGRYAI
ncbi:TonB-dependent siderophore receptor family protein [Paraburkholderia xenovorans LB400]|uniref:TonB-dependent siderophore receptor n=1 Tax=Paraburkholderia xenovorans (strain LB400) TaxID=266265 RepID=Q13G73_PARXL|nr:TonB-dependent receptor [Paraburkholderia xenovorans]ABE36916.1 TonB-dependent siderophore receptor [Paraburkholderia xenovorans LB400]AIP34908.1 TonB-dependent siderophore receptor family protein [Paraburkholderia xenovorans LB400]